MGIIINALFAPGTEMSGAEKETPRPEMTAKVRLADPEGENRLAALEAENRRLKEELASQGKELSALRKELIETLDRHSGLAERLRRMELSVAGTVEALEPVYIGAREEEIAESLRQVSESGRRLAGKAADLCDGLKAGLAANPDKVEAAKLSLKLDELKDEAASLAKLTSPPGSPERFEKCRILEIDDALQALVLSAGFRDGVRSGLALRAGKDGGVLLRVVAVRPFASAAVVAEGDLKGLSPGMEARAASK